MILVTDKNTKVVLAIAEDIFEGKKNLSVWDNGYPLILSSNTAWPQTCADIYESIDVPDNIKQYKYCYTEEQGFYLNPNWVEPDSTNTYGIPDEVYHSIIDDYTAELFGGEV